MNKHDLLVQMYWIAGGIVASVLGYYLFAAIGWGPFYPAIGIGLLGAFWLSLLVLSVKGHPLQGFLLIIIPYAVIAFQGFTALLAAKGWGNARTAPTNGSGSICRRVSCPGF